MSVQVTVNSKVVPGDRYTVACDVTLDSSYTTGGMLLTPLMFQLHTIQYVIIASQPFHGNYYVEYNKTTKALVAYDKRSSPAAEVPAATDLSGVVVQLIVSGH